MGEVVMKDRTLISVAFILLMLAAWLILSHQPNRTETNTKFQQCMLKAQAEGDERVLCAQP